MGVKLKDRQAYGVLVSSRKKTASVLTLLASAEPFGVDGGEGSCQARHCKVSQGCSVILNKSKR